MYGWHAFQSACHGMNTMRTLSMIPWYPLLGYWTHHRRNFCVGRFLNASAHRPIGGPLQNWGGYSFVACVRTINHASLRGFETKCLASVNRPPEQSVQKCSGMHACLRDNYGHGGVEFRSSSLGPSFYVRLPFSVYFGRTALHIHLSASFGIRWLATLCFARYISYNMNEISSRIETI